MAECTSKMLKLRGASLGVDLACPSHVLDLGPVFEGLPVALNKSIISLQGITLESSNSKLREGNAA